MAALYREQVGTRIRTLRRERRWSQPDLAERIGVRPQTISRWERGQNLGYARNLERVADAFGLTVSEFMAGLEPLTQREGEDRLARLEARIEQIEAKLKSPNTRSIEATRQSPDT